jgi:hypothetical protein
LAQSQRGHCQSIYFWEPLVVNLFVPQIFYLPLYLQYCNWICHKKILNIQLNIVKQWEHNLEIVIHMT